MVLNRKQTWREGSDRVNKKFTSLFPLYEDFIDDAITYQNSVEIEEAIPELQTPLSGWGFRIEDTETTANIGRQVVLLSKSFLNHPPLKGQTLHTDYFYRVSCDGPSDDGLTKFTSPSYFLGELEWLNGDRGTFLLSGVWDGESVLEGFIPTQITFSGDVLIDYDEQTYRVIYNDAIQEEDSRPEVVEIIISQGVEAIQYTPYRIAGV